MGRHTAVPHKEDKWVWCYGSKYARSKDYLIDMDRYWYGSYNKPLNSELVTCTCIELKKAYLSI